MPQVPLNRHERREARRRAREKGVMPPEAAALMDAVERAVAARDLAGARQMAERAAKVAPQRPEPQFLLGRIAYWLEEDDTAVRHYSRAVAIAPSWADAQYALGSVLLDRERPAEAEAAFRAALAARPDFAEAASSLGNALLRLDRLDAAEEALAAALRLMPDHAGAHANRAALRLRRGDADGALAAAEESLRLRPAATGAINYKAMAMAALGRAEGAAALVDFDRFLALRPLAPPSGFADIGAFNAALARQALADPTLKPSPPGRTTMGGAQTTNLFRAPTGALAALRDALAAEIGRYRDALGEDPAHPFIAARPRNVTLYAWATVLGRQGHQAPHIHPAAWLSGVYYVNLPPELGAGGGDHAGWIEFGRPPALYPAPGEPRLRLVRPEPGLMALFPSYFWHRTVPFDSGEKRISIAFDALAA
jgi:tetratricopeptide (TPR) repeat protein